MLKHDDMNDGKYISSTDAAFLYGCSKDYISRLCRSGKLKGNLLGRNWFIEVDSFQELLSQKDAAKAETLRTLSLQRKKEYAEAQTKAEEVARSAEVSLEGTEGADDLSDSISTSQYISPILFDEAKPRQYRIFNNVTALVLSIGLVFGVYGMLESSYPSKALNEIVALSGDVQKLFSGNTSGIAESPVSASASYLVAAVGSLTSSASDFFGKSPDANESLFARAFARLAQSLSNTSVATSKSTPSSTFALAPLPKTAPLGRQAPSAAPSTAAQTISRALASSYQPAPQQPIYITKTETISGVSQAYVDTQIQILRNSLSSDIFKFTSTQYPSAPGISQSTANLAISSRIDRLTHATIENSAFNNGTISGTTFSGGSLTDTSISATELSVSGAATFSGGVNLSTGTLTLPYFGATSTTTASYVTYRFGVGTTSPYRDLSVAGSGVFGGDILAGTLTATTSVTSPNLTLSSVGRNMILAIDGSGNVFATSTPTANSFLATSTSATSTFAGGFVAGNSVFNILQNGLVGIGTTSPSAAFAIQGNSYVSGTAFFGGPITSTSTFSVLGGSSFAGFISTASSTIGNGNQNGGLTIFGGATTTGNAYFAGGLGVGVATSAPGVLQTSGDASIGGNLFVAGNSTTLGNSSSNTLTINSSIHSNIVPDQNITYDLGSSSFYWRNVYVGNIIANNISAASTTIAGTASQTFTINSDNVSSDTEDEDLVFFRGNVVPNALLSWKTATKRFEFNQPLFIQNASSNNLTGITLDLKGQAGQTGALFNVASSTGTSAFNITSAGFTGVGTTTPWAQFSINPTSANNSAPAFVIGSSTATKFIVDAAGNVGIGTTTPSASLDVNGNLAITALGARILGDYSNATIANRVAFQSNITNGNTNFSFLPNGTSVTSAINAYNNSDPTNAAYANFGINSVSVRINSDIRGTGTYLPMAFFTGGSERMRLDTAGNLGIGTTSPWGLLSVNANGLASSSPQFVVGSSTKTDFIVANNGNVGLGTTSPQFKLSLAGSAATLATGPNIEFYDTSGDTNSRSWVIGNSFSTNYGDLSFAVGTAAGAHVVSGNNVKMTLDKNGNLGIGTTTPWRTLSVNGSSDLGINALAGYFTATSTTASSFAGGFTSFASTTIGAGGQATGLTIFGGATTTGNAYIAGNVGIGSTTPNSALVVNAHGGVRLANLSAGDGLFADNGISSGIFSLTRQDTVANGDLSVAAYGGIGFKGGSQTYNNAVASGYAMYLTSTNNVGIGTTTPQTALSVNGGSALTASSFFGSANFTSTGGSTGVALGNFTGGYGAIQGYGTYGNTASYLLLNPAGGNVGIGTTSDAYFFGVKTNATNSAVGINFTNSSNTSLLAVTNVGNVGIGSTTPFAKLSVKGAGTTSGVNFQTTNSSDSPLFTILDSGNVGIGSTTPNKKLVVAGGSTFANAVNQGMVEFDYTGTSAALEFGRLTNSNLGSVNYLQAFSNTLNSSQSLAINPFGSGTGGYVSLGTTTAYAALGIMSNGTTAATRAFEVANFASTTLFLINDAGSVGIGSTTPNNKLDVAGNIYSSGFHDTSGTTGGYKIDGNSVLYASSTTGGTFGGLSGGTWAAASSTIVRSTAFGYHALNATPSAGGGVVTDLTAFGYLALSANTGDGNAAFGSSALYQNTSGTENAAFGSGALGSNTTGVANVAIGGRYALDHNTTGGSNVAIGRTAMDMSVTGSDNTAVGTNASRQNTSATSTVAIGSGAAHGIGGLYNAQGYTALGYKAGNSFQTGADYNTLVGYLSGFGVTTGQKNISLGAFTSSANANITSGSNNIVIGNDVSVADGTASNQINIANILFGTNNSTTGSKYATGQLGVGSSSPYARFGIHANNGDTNTTLFAIGSSTPTATTTLFSVNNTGAITAAGTLNVTGLSTFAGLFSTASSTIGAGTQAAGLTIFGGATTTGNAYFAGTVGIGMVPTTNSLSIGGYTAGNITNRVVGNFFSTNSSTDLDKLLVGGGESSNMRAYMEVRQTWNGSFTDTELGFTTTRGGTGAAERLTILGGGNVGVGSTTPYAKLSVKGAGSTTGVNFQTTNSSDNPLFTILDSGNVGIGTTTSATTGSLLSVAGNIFSSGFHNTSGTTGGYQIDGNLILQASSTNGVVAVGQSALSSYFTTTSTAGETALGFQALNSATSSLGDTAVGYQALKGSATISSIGQNTAVGYRALTANTGGTDNTGVGWNALLTNTSGIRNTALGSQALLSVSTGGGNTALGFYTLRNLSTGSNNIGVGQQSVAGLQTGSDNIAIGSLALQNSLGASSNNIVMGSESMRYNFSATSSVAIGYRSGYGNATQYNNQGGVYLGYQTGLNVQTGSDYNTLLGYQAGAALTTGANNIIIGAASTLANDNLTSGSNNIKIGYNNSFASPTGNNQLNIQNILFGANNSTTGGTYAVGQIGVGSTSPYARFGIHANNGDTNTTLFAIGSSTPTATTTLFSVNNIGQAMFADGSVAQPSITFGTSGMGFLRSSGSWYYSSGSVRRWRVFGATLTMGSDGNLNWSNSTDADGASDTGIGRLGVGTVSVNGSASGNGTLIAGTVGVGTSSPYAQLSIATPNGATGSVGTLFAIASSTATATSTLFAVTNAGNVGIGTTSPWATLSVEGISTLGNQALAGFFTATSTTASTFAGGITSSATTTASYFAASSLGTAGAPAFTFSGDLNTGMYNIGADQLGFTAGGTLRAQATANGFGIGAAPSTVGNSNTALVVQGTGTQENKIVIQTETGTNAVIEADRFGGATTQAGVLRFSKQGGSIASPSSLSGNDVIGLIDFQVRNTGGLASPAQITASVPGSANNPNTPANLNFLVSNGSDTSAKSALVITAGAASAVNYLQIANSATLAGPTISAQGSDTNINLNFTPKGTGSNIFTAGNVGIGSTTPWAKLSVEGISTLGNQAIAGYFTATSTTATSTFAGGLTVGTNGLTVFPNGFVGVGATTTPGYNMSVFGSASFGNSVSTARRFDIDSSGAVSSYYGDNSIRAIWTAYNQGITGASQGNEIGFRMSSTTANSLAGASIRAVTESTYLTDSAVGLQFLVGTQGSINSALAINSNRNVGISSSTPWGRLSVTGAGVTTGKTFAVADNNGLPTFVIQDNGSVGIGTSSPLSRLSIQGSNTTASTADFVYSDSNGAPKVQITNGGSLVMATTTALTANIPLVIGGAAGGGSWARFCRDDSSFFCSFLNSGNGAFNFANTGGGFFTWANGATISGGNYSGATQAMALRGNTLIVGTSTDNSASGGHVGIWGTGGFNYLTVTDVTGGASNFGDIFKISSTGNTGAGTTTPWGKLSASSTSAAPTLAIQQNSTGPAAIFMGGNVGIGSTTPGSLLSVAGNIFSSGFHDTSGTTGGYKIDGNSVLYASSTSFVTFGGIGAGAGIIANATSSNVTSAPFATAFGYQALGNATSSPTNDLSGNTAFGYQALLGNATNFRSTGNTAVGYNTLKNITIGTFNTAVGYSAGSSLTTGGFNVSIGRAVGDSNQTGNNNIIVGDLSMHNWTAPTSNVGMGQSVFSGTGTGGTLDAAFGHQSSQNMTSGTRNATFGALSGNGITSGANNTFLGYGTATTTQTSSNNIAIGYDIELPSANGSNQLNIGNLLFGTGINGEGTVLSTGKIGIGSTTPYARLSVYAQNGDTNTTLFAVGSTTATAISTLFNVQNTGYVGIGTTTPYARLSVDTTNLTSDAFAVGSSTTPALTVTGDNKFRFGRTLNSTEWFSIVAPTTISSSETVFAVHAPNSSPYLGQFFNDSYSNSSPELAYFGWNSTGAGSQTGMVSGDFEFIGGKKLIFATNGSYTNPRMAITDTGLVGIGTTSPSLAYLTVVPFMGATGSIQNLFLVASTTPTATTTVFEITNAGNVGIGTTSPSQLLSIGGSHPLINLQDTANGRGAYFGLSDGFNTTVNNTGGGLVALQNNGTNALTTYGGGVSIGSYAGVNLPPSNGVIISGNVGIGTTTPISTARLHTFKSGSAFPATSGSTQSAGHLERIDDFSGAALDIGGNGGSGYWLQVANTANLATNYNLLLNPNGGNVGIGATAPVSKLSVTGTSGAWVGDGISSIFSVTTGTGVNTDEKMEFGILNGSYGYIQAVKPGTIARSLILNPGGGNIGIGTTTPQSKLSVVSGTNGTLNFPSGNWAAQIYNQDDAATSGGLVVGNRWLADTSTVLDVGSLYGTGSAWKSYLTVKGAGSVGIGTTSPRSTLDVGGGGSTGSVAIGNGGYLYTYGGGTNVTDVRAGFQMDGTNQSLNVYTANTYRGGWNSSGNLGIGTASPSDKFDIRGNMKVGAGDQLGTIAFGDVAAAATSSGAGLYVGRGLDSVFSSSALSVGGFGGIAFHTSDSAGATTTAKMVITSGGNVGIGTTSPLAKLAIDNGLGGVAQDGLFVINSGNSGYNLLRAYSNWTDGSGGNLLNIANASGNALFINANRNVGIGTTTPQTALSVSQDAPTLLTLDRNNASARKGEIAFTQQGALRWELGADLSGTNVQNFYLWDSVAATARLFVDPSGNVGIGTTTPGAKLDIYNGALCVDDNTPTCANAARTAGTIYAVATAITGIDLAERYPTKDANLDAGEIVGFDPSNPVFVAHATSSGNFLGVVSTAPGIVLGGYNEALYKTEKKVPIALAGRVPVKVNLEGGDINVGDAITLSSVAGVGTKATTTTQTIGVALEPYTTAMATSTTGTIQVFIKPELTISAPDRSKLADVLSESTTTTAGVLADADETSTFSTTLRSGIQNLENAVVKVFNSAVYASTGIFNKVFAKEVHTDKVCVSDTSGETCITKAQLDALLAGAAASQGGSSSGGGSGSGSGSGTTTPDTTGPVIDLLGANPATTTIGAAYVDLGATVTDNVSQNLGYTVSLDGATSTEASLLYIDTSTAGTHSLVFTATDQAGNTGMATRTVVVE